MTQKLNDEIIQNELLIKSLSRKFDEQNDDNVEVKSVGNSSDYLTKAYSEKEI